MDTAYYNQDLQAFKKALDTNDLEMEYPLSKNTFKGQPFSSEYHIIGEGLFKGTPLVSLTAQSALGYDRAIDFMKALLSAGADPNHVSIMRGITPLGYLYQLERKYPQFYKKSNYLGTSLTDTIRALLAAGADYEEYIEQNQNAFTTSIIQDVLNETRGDIFSNKRFVPVSDYTEQYTKFCQDLSKETNLTELRVIAREFNIPTTGLHKADICHAIAQHLASIEAMSKDKSNYDAYREDDYSE